MPQATFILKEPNSKDETLVYLIYRFNSTKLKYSTGQKINPKYWNPLKQRTKETRQFPQYANFNLLLNKIESSVNTCFRKLLLEEITPTPEHLRSYINQVLKKENSTSKDLASFGESLINNSARKESTKKSIRQTIRLLKEYKEKSKKSLHFDSIDLDFYNDFIDFLFRSNYGLNTIGGHIKNIKVFMREALERGLTKNAQFQSKRFKRPEEESESIYLNSTELNKLYSLDLSEKPRLERVRDLFLVACNTGLRFSDLTQVKFENINKEKGFIKLRTIKTDENIIIPINSQVKAIIEKYSGHLPIAISNQKMNDYLKEIAELAGLRDKIEIVSNKGGKRLKEVFQKHELITVHTARRSFATNAFISKVPTISIMKITGHRTEKSFMKYIKISQEDNANKLIDHPFFK